MSKLIVTDGAGSVTEHALEGGSTSIGRGSECDVVLLHEGVSRIHAVVEHEGGAILLRDQQSHNGTWMNGERVEEVRLSDGDEFTVGETSFRVVLDAGPAAEAGRESDGEPESGPEPSERVPAKGAPPKKRSSRRRSAGAKDRRAGSSGQRRGRDRAASERRSDARPGGATRRGRRPRRAESSGQRRGPDRAAGKETRRSTSGSARERGGAPGAEDEPTVSLPRREILGGMRLTKRQQTTVKIVSAAVSFLCLMGIVWLLSTMGRRQPSGSGVRYVDPLAKPETLAEEARALAKQAWAAEDRNDIDEACRLITDAKTKMDEAAELMRVLAQKYDAEGFSRIQKKSSMLATQARGIRDQWFRLTMQQERYSGKHP